MKPLFNKLVIIIILSLLCFLLFCSCNNNDIITNRHETTESTVIKDDNIKLSRGRVEGDYIKISKKSEKYTIVYPQNDFAAYDMAAKIRNAIKSKTGLILKIQGDREQSNKIADYKYEILIGNTNRCEGVNSGREGFTIKAVGSKIFICGSNSEMLQKGVDCFISRYIDSAIGEIKIHKNTHFEEIFGAHNLSRTSCIIDATAIEYSTEKNEYKISVATNTTKINLAGVAVSIMGSFDKSCNFASDTLKLNATKDSIYTCSFVFCDVPRLTASEFIIITATPYVLVNGDFYYGEKKTVIFNNNEKIEVCDIEKRNDLYLIYDIFDLILFTVESNNGKRYINAELQSDITIPKKYDFTPIGGENASYKGVFDGNGYEIKDMLIEEVNIPKIGMFGVVGSDAVIRNLTLQSVTVLITNSTTAGIIAGENRGEIINCKAINSKIKGTNSNDRLSVGGIAGILNGKYSALIDECTFDGNINIESEKTAFVGGIVGNSTATKAVISRCINYGNINLDANEETGGKSSIGGITGVVASGLIVGCENQGRVTGSKADSACGGISGSVTSMARIVDCANTAFGIVQSNFAAGGIVGVFEESVVGDGMVLRSYNTGNVNSFGFFAGGIVGMVKTNAYIYYSYNKGEVKSMVNAGGICGYTNIKHTAIMNCFNIGMIFSGDTQNANEIIGKADKPFSCSFTGETNSEDVYINYHSNFYIIKYNSKGEQINYAYNNQKSSFGCENMAELKKFIVNSNDYFMESENHITPIFAYQADKSKISSEIPLNLYSIYSQAIENDNSGHYLSSRYIKNIYDGKDNIFEVSVSEFFENYNTESNHKHSVILKNGEVLCECTCSVFEGDHYIKTEVWKWILEDVEKYLQKSADLFNYGEILAASTGIKVDINTDSHAYCTKVKNGDKQYYDKIALNPAYFNTTEDRGIIAHELAHAMHGNFGCETWLKEGMADYAKYKNAGDVDNVLSSKTSNYKYKEGYIDTAAVLIFIENNFGDTAIRQIIRMMEKPNSDIDALMFASFGATYEEIFYRLFCGAELVSDIVSFED